MGFYRRSRTTHCISKPHILNLTMEDFILGRNENEERKEKNDYLAWYSSDNVRPLSGGQQNGVAGGAEVLFRKGRRNDSPAFPEHNVDANGAEHGIGPKKVHGLKAVQKGCGRVSELYNNHAPRNTVYKKQKGDKV